MATRADTIVTADLFKFPHTPHLAWLGAGQPRDDKVLSAEQRDAFLAAEILVEEKIDGANLGLSIGPDARVRVQNRGAFLGRGAHAQFEPLWGWLAPREHVLARGLGGSLTIFGEWCFAVHSVPYSSLPDWFLGFDVYDRDEGHFWSSARRNQLFRSLGIAPVPAVARGRFDLAELSRLLENLESRVGSGLAEGLYLRREDPRALLNRAKLVRAEFARGIEEHWTRRGLERNRLAPPAPSGGSPSSPSGTPEPADA